MTNATVTLNRKSFNIPVIGARSDLNESFERFALFQDGRPAGKIFPYGLGKVVAVGFLPMIAYAKLARFRPATLAEKWPPEPREIIAEPLKMANIKPVASADKPVVEVNYLDGPAGAAIVLANYTYKPIDSLTIKIRTRKQFTRASSGIGTPVTIVNQKGGELTLRLPLEWTDIITLK